MKEITKLINVFLDFISFLISEKYLFLFSRNLLLFESKLKILFKEQKMKAE